VATNKQLPRVHDALGCQVEGGAHGVCDLEFEKHLAAIEKQLLSLQRNAKDKLKPEERAELNRLPQEIEAANARLYSALTP
jgi:hypothetical protein